MEASFLMLRHFFSRDFTTMGLKISKQEPYSPSKTKSLDKKNDRIGRIKIPAEYSKTDLNASNSGISF